MPGKALIFLALLVFSVDAFSATKGKLTRQFFTCGGAYALWEVYWMGAGTTGQADLMEGETNLNWTKKAERVTTPTGNMAPATNLRWYRVRSQTFIPFKYVYTSMCWIPQQRCGSQRAR
jgi:hypothetical protein